jgi:hypothetical protein
MDIKLIAKNGETISLSNHKAMKVYRERSLLKHYGASSIKTRPFVLWSVTSNGASHMKSNYPFLFYKMAIKAIQSLLIWTEVVNLL